MAPIRSQWTGVHGDTSRSPIFAIVTDQGTTVDLSTWAVRAQLRASTESTTVLRSFSVGNGITIGSAKVSTSGGSRGMADTSTLQLYLLPAHYGSIPRPFTGVVDIEISSDAGASPTERHTVAILDVSLDRDVTR